jgi:hypothetical protein
MQSIHGFVQRHDGSVIEVAPGTSLAEARATHSLGPLFVLNDKREVVSLVSEDDWSAALKQRIFEGKKWRAHVDLQKLSSPFSSMAPVYGCVRKQQRQVFWFKRAKRKRSSSGLGMGPVFLLRELRERVCKCAYWSAAKRFCRETTQTHQKEWQVKEENVSSLRRKNFIWN